MKLIFNTLCLLFIHTICLAQQVHMQFQNTATKPQINSPVFFGVRTGKYFFYTIPASGERPIKIEVRHLPAGLSYNQSKGIISGQFDKNGRYKLEIVAANKKGTANKYFTIIAGDKLALTPPMGWSSWYSYGRKAKEADILKTAQLMKHYGLDQYGWSILEIDDPWTNQPNAKDSIWSRLTHKVNNEVYQYHEGPANLPDREGKLREQDGTLLPDRKSVV